MNKKAAFQLSVNFLVIIIICIVVFGFSIYIVRKFFTHAEKIRMTYDERTEKEIERLLDDGSKVAIPFDKKTIGNGEFKTFGIGILNVLNIGPSNLFKVNVNFSKAFDRRNDLICDTTSATKPPSLCGDPDDWLETTAGLGGTITKTIKNNEQKKFLLGVSVKDAPKGTYIFDLNVTYEDPDNLGTWIQYDTLHKLYVDVP